ncbi:histidine phosphatase family protein [Methylacidiphilum caldifontis]|uniref:Phosphoglycerate mutase n=2 Tax=Methylacidiphilum caldifontis TaxID=2795386 RepID=A0A4Y8P9Q0_9BACT|nr:histidine phosphatase family protein [Methylacidiphilum caldifontis]TFE65924.1 phosphoglycerate mutase [Methylacidiphilum caldifontis]
MGALYFARHCKTAWNLEHRIQGRTDIPLCEVGIEEAKKNSRLIAQLNIGRVYSSPLIRGKQTAQIYAQSLNIPYEIKEELIEMDMGEWEGKTAQELSLLKPSVYLEWIEDPRRVPLVPGSKEDVFSAQKRIVKAVRDVYFQQAKDFNILIILHKYICSLLRCALQNLDLNHFKQEIIESTLPQNVSVDSPKVFEAFSSKG